MAKWFGKIGFGITEEVVPGVWKPRLITRELYGDVLSFRNNWSGSQNQNDDVTITNELSIVADPFTFEHFNNIRFVEYLGARWKVTSVTVEYPRLRLSLGGLFNDDSDAETT